MALEGSIDASRWAKVRMGAWSHQTANLRAVHVLHHMLPHTSTSCLWGSFRTARAQRGNSAHSANYSVVYPGNTPENHPPTEACMIHSKQHQGCRIQDPGTRGKHQIKAKNAWCTSRGCRVQNSGPWDPWLTVVKKQPTFRTARAQRTVRLLCSSLAGFPNCISLLTRHSKRQLPSDGRERTVTRRAVVPNWGFWGNLGSLPPPPPPDTHTTLPQPSTTHTQGAVSAPCATFLFPFNIRPVLSRGAQACCPVCRA